MISELACKKWQAFMGFAPFAAIHLVSNELQSRSFKIDGVTKRSLAVETVEDDIPYSQSALTLLSAAFAFLEISSDWVDCASQVRRSCSAYFMLGGEYSRILVSGNDSVANLLLV
jgi:hypothetical protein